MDVGSRGTSGSGLREGKTTTRSYVRAMSGRVTVTMMMAPFTTVVTGTVECRP